MHHHKLISSNSGDDEIHQYDVSNIHRNLELLSENVCEKAGQVGKKSAGLGVGKTRIILAICLLHGLRQVTLMISNCQSLIVLIKGLWSRSSKNNVCCKP